MENASKALLIAAGVLIVILLITFGIRILGSADDTAKQAQDVGDSMSLATKDATSKLDSLFDKLGGGSASLNHSGTITEGGTYTSKNGTTYNAGEKMPTPQTGDTYMYGDYIYDFKNNGWNVSIKDKNQNSYDNILGNINGKAINSMRETFRGCSALTKAPKIPNTVTNLYFTFWNCNSLTEAPTIPKGVTNMNGTFSRLYVIS